MHNIKIETPDISEDFQVHLDIPDNNCILFSAPFGAGKTTFLEEFFTERKELYNYVHLFPVYYSVSGNEDIFELIKYDILFELMLRYKDKLSERDAELDFSRSLALQLYINNEFRPLDLFQKLAALIFKTGKEVSEVIDIARENKRSFDEYFKGMHSGDIDMVDEYSKGFERAKGTIHEYDAISQLIAEFLQRLKGTPVMDDYDERQGEGLEENTITEDDEISEEKETVKQNVLVIDDLDRMDPEHVFRIFNIFSAHQDWKTRKNKFGFDKVIVVCDDKNIRYIYEHRYGKNVDFVGYINKFYSKRIYNFDNAAHIINQISTILNGLNSEEVEKARSIDIISKYDLRKSAGSFFGISITYFLQGFLKTGLIELRSLVNMPHFSLKRYNFYDRDNSGFEGKSINYEFLMLAEFFSQLFGSLNSFAIKLGQLSQLSSADPRYIGISDSMYTKGWGEWIIGYCLAFLNTMDTKVNPNDLWVTVIDKKIFYRSIHEGRRVQFQFLRITDSGARDLDITDLNLFVLMDFTLKRVMANGILR